MNRRRFLTLTLCAAAWQGLRRHTLAAEPAGPVLDAHAHVISPGLSAFLRQEFEQGGLPPMSGEDVLRRLDADGIGKAIILSNAYLFAGDEPGREDELESPAGEYDLVKAENDYALGETRSSEGRLIGFCSVNPKRPYAVGELRRCVEKLGARGLKLQFWSSNVDLRQQEHLGRVRELFSEADRLRLPVVIHFFNGELADFGARDVGIFVGQVLKKLPRLRVNLAHVCGGGGYNAAVADTFDAFIEAGAGESFDRTRLFLDLATVFFERPFGPLGPLTEDQAARLGGQLRAWGLERVLWGTDNLPNYVAATRSQCPLTAEELQRVFRNRGDGFLGA